VSGGAPLDSLATAWGAAGWAGTVARNLGARFSLGADLGGDGYVYDDRAGGSGRGATLYALPWLRVTRGAGTLELRGGGHDYLFSYPDTSGSRALLELGARGTLGLAAAELQGDVRWLAAEEGDYPYASGQVSLPFSVVRVWGWAGKWLAETLDDVEWGAGLSVTAGPIGDVWVSYRQVATDPLYLAAEQSGWNVGITKRFGAAPGASPALVPRVLSGAVRIRLPLEMTDGRAAAPSVAGEFSEWKPVAMTRDGSEWVLDLPLSSGVYRFSFVTSSGEWFVPERYPGRIDDGFGGSVALLVVP
jgi:hypothetical protein